MNRVIFPVVNLVCLGLIIYELKNFSTQNLSQAILVISKYLIMISLLVFSRPTKDFRFSFTSVISTLATFIMPMFLEYQAISLNYYQFVVFLFTFVFFNILLIISYFSLGRNLSVTPEVKNIVTSGMYEFVKHPIYSQYISIIVLYTTYFFSFRNLTITVIFCISMYFRAKEEEKLLNTSAIYRKKFINKPMFLSRASFLILVCSMMAFFILKTKNRSIKKEIRVHLGYPAYSLYPHIYDDWGGVFIGNHIYKRLLPSKKKIENHIAENFRISCVGSRDYNKECKKVEINFSVKPFKDCNGVGYDFEDIKKELLIILKKKNWVLPNVEFCQASRGNICLQGDNVRDIYRKFDNLYFRFGWSKRKTYKDLIGSGKYCL